MATTLVTGAATGRLHQLDAVSTNVNETLQGLAGFAGGGCWIWEGGRPPVQEGKVVGFSEKIGVVTSRVKVLPSHYEVRTEITA